MRTSLNVKKYQRMINRVIRSLNEGIASDHLWRGRFYIRQKQRYCTPYEDKSGLSTFFVFTLYDLKTGFTKDIGIDGVGFEYPANGWKIWRELNDFIVEDCDVWHNREELFADKTVYRKPKEAFQIEKYQMAAGR